MANHQRQATTLHIDQGVQERLKTLADDRKISAHDLMLEAIAEYVDREEKRSSYRKEAQASWLDYQETGEHITASETITWLESWGTGHEQDAPECHK